MALTYTGQHIMPTLTSEAAALISLMDRQYREIREIEAAHSIMGREGDFRPRIEHYQDAVRVLTSGTDEALSKDSRLSVERLAYDLALLRHITAKPLTAGRGQGHFSPHTDVAVAGEPGSGGMPREERQRLGQIYKDYTVLFAAIFAEKADRNADARTEEANATIADCHELQELLEGLAKGQVNVAEVVAMAQHVENTDLRKAINALLQQKNMQKAILQQAAERLKTSAKGLDKEIHDINKAAMSYATGQLAVYEESKDTVKRLAASGLNIAGKFVENAMAQAQAHSRGR